MAQEIATLAGGCFWCIEAVFDDVIGVSSVESGYIGGRVPNPTYKQVCNGDTGHAEAIRVTFDPDVIGYGELLDIFFHVHDPTQLNRQGNDVGTQYRSAIFPHSPAQEAEATAEPDAATEVAAAPVEDAEAAPAEEPAADDPVGIDHTLASRLGAPHHQGVEPALDQHAARGVSGSHDQQPASPAVLP